MISNADSLCGTEHERRPVVYVDNIATGASPSVLAVQAIYPQEIRLPVRLVWRNLAILLVPFGSGQLQEWRPCI